MTLRYLVSIFFVVFFFGVSAHAYIPNSKMIASRVARNASTHPIVIEDEIVFRTNGDPVTLHEHWVVVNAEKMHVVVTSHAAVASTKGKSAVDSDPVHFEAVYRDGRRVADDLRGGHATETRSPEFLESFFYAKTGPELLSLMTRSGLIPSSLLRERPMSGTGVNAKPLPEAYVRLGRVNGVVNYVFGEPTPVDGKRDLPGVWIEQDAFVIRKFRFPSEAELVADNYLTSSSAKLPRDRTLTWGNNSATIRILSVKAIPLNQATTFVATQSLNSVDAQKAHLPSVPQIEEFYARFR